MEVDKNITQLVCELEHIIGAETYNPNSYNGWTCEEGCSYKFPVSYCKNKKALEEGDLCKTRSKVNYIDPECINTMKYVFGSNHLYIGSGIVETLRYLERVYNLDFNKLEEKRLQKRMKVMEKRKKQLIETQKININSGEYVVNVDIPEGTYLFDKDENGQSLLLVNIYNEEGDSVDSVYVHSKEISLNAGDLVRVSYSCTLRIE